MKIQLFSLSEYTPEGFKSINTFDGLLPSATIILYAETVQKALAFLRAYPAKPRGVIVTPGESFISSPASPSFWHLAIPEKSMSAVKSIAESYLDTFGYDDIPISDSYEALQSRISDLLLKVVENKRNEDRLGENETELKLVEAARNIPGMIFQFYIRKTGEYGLDFVSGNLEDVFGIPKDTENLFESFVHGIPSKELKDEFSSSIDNAVKTLENWNFETSFVKPSGEMIHIRGISKPTLLNDAIILHGIMMDVTEQRNASQHVEDLNSLLLSIRNVNQLIVQETRLEGLLQNACETLIETRSYQNCTIMLLDDEQTIGQVFQSGTENYFKDELISGFLPVCVAKAVDTGKYVIMKDPDQCAGCEHLGKHGENFYPTFVAPMKSENRTVGILFVTLSNEAVVDEEEGAFLQEVTDDITFAVGKLDAEAKQIKSEERYRKLFVSSHDAMMILEPPSWKFTSGNPSLLEMFCVSSEEELITMGPWNLSPRYQSDGQLSSDKAHQMIGIALREGSHLFEWTHQRLSGEEFQSTVLMTRVDMQENSFIQATVKDMT